MKYMGSKNRHAKHILPIILKNRKEGQWFVEPFCGGCNITDKVDGPRIANDTHPQLIALMSAASEGWVPPEFVSEEDYARIRAENKIDALSGYVGFSLSFGGKFWGGYRRGGFKKDGSPRNYSDESYRSFQKQVPKLKGVKFTCQDYRDLEIPEKSIVYCDPPYAKTTGYKTGGFDHDAFWAWCEKLVEDGHEVFVSEYNAPPNWGCVWSKEVNNTLTKDTGSKKGVEKLFVLCKDYQ